MNEQWLEKVVAGCVRDTIRAHGPVDKERIGSAAKRIAHQIFGELKAAAGKGDGHEVCEAKVAELQKEVKRLERRMIALAKSVKHWMGVAGATEQDEIERLRTTKPSEVQVAQD